MAIVDFISNLSTGFPLFERFLQSNVKKSQPKSKNFVKLSNVGVFLVVFLYALAIRMNVINNNTEVKPFEENVKWMQMRTETIKSSRNQVIVITSI